MSFNTISVIGLGYIGLPTAALFASKNKRVVGVDINKKTINTINQGKIHIIEPALDKIVQRAVNNGFLTASIKAQPAEAFLIAVPTPFINKAGERIPDLSYIKKACKTIAPVLKKGDLLVLESTSPVGTTEQLTLWLRELRQDLSFPLEPGAELESDINIAYCPERVLPGQVVKELVKNSRVIGGLTSKCSARAVELYKIFVQGECIVTQARTAEMVKLTENSFRDVQIAFANELSLICDKLSINVWELIHLANRHPRVNILQPGAGVGGHCIAVDPWFIVNKTPKESRLIKTARIVNDSKPDFVFKKIQSAVQQVSNNKFQKTTVACLGLAFKADIDDLRESPALEITSKLLKKKIARVLIVEPHINALPNNWVNFDCQLTNYEKALKQAQIVVILVDHSEFKKISPTLLKDKILIDTKGLFNK